MSSYSFRVVNGRKVFADGVLTEHSSKLTVVKPAASKATVSVLIPTMERPEFAMCLQALARSFQAAQATAHLVIIDQSTTKEGRQFAFEQAKMAAGNDAFASVFYDHDIRHTISSAKNRGAALLRQYVSEAELGELLIIIDSDIYMTPSGIGSLITAARECPDIAAFSLPSVWLRDNSQLAWLVEPPDFDALAPTTACKPEQQLLDRGHPVQNGKLMQVPAIHGCVFAVRLPVFDSVGGFHEFFGMHGEHVELCHRLKHRGHSMAYVMEPVVLHDDREVSHSVMRNLPGREQYLLSTIIAMSSHDVERDDLFTELIRTKWLPNVGVADTQISAVLRLINLLAYLLNTCKESAFPKKAAQAIRCSGLPVAIIGHFEGAVAYIEANRQLLSDRNRPELLADVEISSSKRENF